MSRNFESFGSSPFFNGDNTLCLHLASVCHGGVAEARQRTLVSSRSEFALRDRSLVCWLRQVMFWACFNLVALPYRYWDLITCALILHQGGSNFGWEGPFAPSDRFVGAIIWDVGALCAVDDASKCSLSNLLLVRIFRIFFFFFVPIAVTLNFPFIFIGWRGHLIFRLQCE